MSGIFGLVNLDGAPVDTADVEAMRAAMAHWGPDGGGTVLEGAAGFGQCLLFNTPEAVYECLPRLVGRGCLFTAEARIDNRDDLFDVLGVPMARRSSTSDGDLIWLAYERWGEDAPAHLLGDWSFAVWDARERRLFVARDQYGRTALYVHRRGDLIAFASDRKALLALPVVSSRLNEDYLAQVLVMWSVDRGQYTAHIDIDRVPAGHWCSASSGRWRMWRYWRPDHVGVVRTKSQSDWIELLGFELNRAVAARLRSYRPVASMLSGGLDSGTVSLLAARGLASRGQVLAAYTAVPAFETSGLGRGHFGDEGPLARRTAAASSNIRHVELRSEGVSPLAGVRRMLQIHSEPQLAAENLHWLVSLYEAVRADGATVLLSGQGGNLTFSWRGSRSLSWRSAQSVREAVQRGVGKWPSLLAVLNGVRDFVRSERRGGASREEPWKSYSAIHPEFARRIGLRARMAEAGHNPSMAWARPLTRSLRLHVLNPLRDPGGALAAENGAAFGMETRDPTLDVRVIEAAFCMPEEMWRGPTFRWVAREMTRGLLPDAVRLNLKRGKQSADIHGRMRVFAAETREALAGVRGSCAEEMVDICYLEDLSRRLEAPTSDPSPAEAGVLLRGLAMALFISQQQQ